MGVVIMIAQLILALTILVTIHELGHFLAARWFGVRVDKFFVFFDAWGKKLLSFKRGDTEYGIGWLPLGGYVKIAGMIDESMDKDYLKSEPKEWEFRSKKPWQKLIIMLGGIVFNIVLGTIIFVGFAMANKNYVAVKDIGSNFSVTEYGKEQGLREGDVLLGANGKTVKRVDDLRYELAFGGELDVERNGEKVEVPIPKDNFKNGALFEMESVAAVGSVDPNSNADKAGLKSKDRFVSINNTPVETSEDVVNIISNLKDGTANILVTRDGNQRTLEIPVSEKGTIGMSIGSLPIMDNYTTTKASIGDMIGFGIKDAFNVIFINARAMAKMATGEVKAKENLAGPIKIATYFGAQWNWVRFWLLTASLSMILAFMNILPIPALDGGHAVFAIIEWITGKPVNDKILETAQLIGFVMIMSLMVFIFWNDIAGLINR